MASGAALTANRCIRPSSGRPITLESILVWSSRSDAAVEIRVEDHAGCAARLCVGGDKSQRKSQDD